MKPQYAVALAILCGIGGAAGVQSLHAQAQAKPPVYVVAEVSVTDPATFADYAKKQGALVAKNGGRFIIRGGEVTPLEGTPPGRFTIYVFDNMERMQAWRNAPEQKDLIAERDKAGKFRSFAVPGCTDCAPPANK